MESIGRHRLGLAALLIATVGALALEAGASDAAVRWVVKGRGFGHGVGMSQYGAYGYARHGKGHPFVLHHYYRGTSVGKLGGTRVVRVLLEIDGGDVGFTAARGACGRRLDPDRHYEAHLRGNGVRLRSSGGKLLERCDGKLRAAGRGRIRIAGVGAYRGVLEVVPTRSSAGSLNVINAVSVNQYVKGVVSNEMPSSWPIAALRTQAVASRSYGLAAGVDGNGFDLYDDTSSQVYGGIASETRRGNRAASSTRSQVVRYGGAIAETFFSACSGGRTESVENVFFGSPVPYLKSVKDPFDYYCPLHEWKLRFSGPAISSRLGAHLKGRLKRIVVTKRGDSPRIVWARLYGTRGVSKIRGDSLQSALGAYDRWMHFRKVVGGH
jgi:stage II sporulation protein D